MNKFLIYFALIIAGYLFGELHFHNILSVDYLTSKTFFNESKIFFEVTYYIVTSLLFPIAYFQFIHEKKKVRKNEVEYTHKLFIDYTEIILKLDGEFNQERLRRLSCDKDPAEIRNFNFLLNKIDTFSAAFIYGIADIETGKRMMGNTFCQQIESYIPVIKAISGNNYRDQIENLFDLYDKWKVKDGKTL